MNAGLTMREWKLFNELRAKAHISQKVIMRETLDQDIGGLA